MALSTRLIKGKMKSVANIGKITKAMEMVAASKMKKAVDAAVATREYAALALDLLVNISKERYSRHPLLHTGKGDKDLVIVIAADKGLCGGFNVNVAKAVANLDKNGNGESVDISNADFITVGKYAERIARRIINSDSSNSKALASFIDLPDDLSVEEVGGIVNLVISEFQAGNYRKVSVVSTKYVSAIKNETVCRQLLPINQDLLIDILSEFGGEKRSKDFYSLELSQYLFEPGEIKVLELVLPRLVEVQIYQGLLESKASEHSARMVAMKNASDNAKDLLDDLKLGYNHARQEAVTNEISEIAAGADALAS